MSVRARRRCASLVGVGALALSCAIALPASAADHKASTKKSTTRTTVAKLPGWISVYCKDLAKDQAAAKKNEAEQASTYSAKHWPSFKKLVLQSIAQEKGFYQGFLNQRPALPKVDQNDLRVVLAGLPGFSKSVSKAKTFAQYSTAAASFFHSSTTGTAATNLANLDVTECK